MTEPVKGQSNPFSTGDGGPTFESRVQAAFTVLMLTGRFAPCLAAWPITKLKLQGRYAGFNTDDFILFTEHPDTDEEAKLLAQIKHDISITEGNETFAEVIQAAWADFNDPSFSVDTDAFALITGPLSATDTKDVRPLLEWARYSENEKEFLDKVNTANFSSDAKRKKLQVFKTHLAKANDDSEVSDREFWEFMKIFYLLGYDLDTESGSTISLLLSSIILGHTNDALSFVYWAIKAIQFANQNAGTITRTTLPQDITGAFGNVGNSNWVPDLRKLEDHGSYILDGIETTIGGVHVELSDEFAKLLEASERSKFVYVTGERGCGKSSLVKEFADYLEDRAPIFCLRAEDLDEAHLDNVFSSIGLESSLGDLEAGFAMMPKKYLLIESIEKLLELERTTAFIDLLNFLKRHGGWTVIATGRDYAYQQITSQYLQLHGTSYSSLEMSGFNDEHILHLSRELKSLDTFVSNSSLRPLLTNPFFTDLAYRIAETGTRFSSEEGEREFRAAVWRDVIAREKERAGGMPLKRKRTFIEVAVRRAKQMVYGVPETEFDDAALLKLEEDNLVRRDLSSNLVSPAHDVLEDWALEHYIEDTYRATSDDVLAFLNALGHEPAMNRAFRLWLHRKLRYGEHVNDLVLSILSSGEIERYWQDETITAVLLGNNPNEFLAELKDQLFANDSELLKRFCFVLRISCKTPDHALVDQLTAKEEKVVLDTRFLIPFGPGWEAIIRFLFENRELISEDLVPHVTTLLDEWTSSMHAEEDLPVPAREAGLLAFYLLADLKDAYRDKGDRKKLLQVIVNVVPAIHEEFSELLETDVFSSSDERDRLPYVADLYKVALELPDTVSLSKHAPDTVIKLALHEWLIDESEDIYEDRYRIHKEVAECFGLYEHKNEFFPASGSKGPFQSLLRFYPRKGLDFILELLNLTAEKYAHSDLDSPGRYSLEPAEAPATATDKAEIRLADGTPVNQYYSGRLWLGYRGHSVMPDLLQSALMALENWLIDLAEHTESQEILAWVFDHILRNSNSVMPTAVLASVATGFPDKVGKPAFTILRTPILYDLDLSRIIQERGGSEVNWFGFGLRRGSFAELYAAERKKAALRPWRQEHLENLIVRLQLSELRNESLAIVDELRGEAPDTESWRFRFHRIDSRGWTPVEDRENNRIVFEPQALESDLEAIQQDTQEEMGLYNRFSALYLWSVGTFEHKALEREYFQSWNEALIEAKKLHEELHAGSVSDLASMHYGGIVRAAAVFLRDHSSELTETDVSWCAGLIDQAVAEYADTDDQIAIVDSTDHHGAAAAASTLPILLDLAVEDTDKVSLKNLTAVALTHANENVRSGAANGIREHLWDRDYEFARDCVTGSIEYARFEQENRQRRRRAHYSSDEDRQTEIAALHEMKQNFREELVQGTLSTDVDEIRFDSYSSRHILTPYLMIPNGSTESTHVSLWSRILTLLFESKESEEDHEQEVHYEPPLNLAKRFADYLLGLSEADIQIFTEKLREGCDKAPDFIDHLLLSVAVATEETQNKERYWVFWGHLSEKVQSIAIETSAHDYQARRQDDRRKLIRGLLGLDIEWQKVDYENQDIALGKDLILEFVTNAGKNPDVFEAMSSLMYHFPSVFFEPGVYILSKHQSETGGTILFEGVNTRYYLDRSIQRFLRIDSTGPLSQKMHQSCLVLLDAIVESGSSGAYYLREHLIRSRRIL